MAKIRLKHFCIFFIHNDDISLKKAFLSSFFFKLSLIHFLTIGCFYCILVFKKKGYNNEKDNRRKRNSNKHQSVKFVWIDNTIQFIRNLANQTIKKWE